MPPSHALPTVLYLHSLRVQTPRYLYTLALLSIALSSLVLASPFSLPATLTVMSSADTPHGFQSTYLDAGTQTDNSPLPECSPEPSQSTGCTCMCSCQASQAPPLPPATPPMASTVAKKERKPTPVSDRSLLGKHPPRFSRVTNRVVSLPELAEETALDETPFVQPRVASMPGAFPPFFPTGMDMDEQESSLDAIPLHALSGTVFTMQHDPRSLGFPQTPSPPAMVRHGHGIGAFSDDCARYGERDAQGSLSQCF